jgi:hypothetical protein
VVGHSRLHVRNAGINSRPKRVPIEQSQRVGSVQRTVADIRIEVEVIIKLSRSPLLAAPPPKLTTRVTIT